MRKSLLQLSVFVVAVLVCTNACAQLKGGENREPKNTVSVPEFTENTRRFLASHGQEPIQQYIWVNNQEALLSIFKLDSELVRREMIRRVSDETYPLRLRNLAAAVLMVRNENAGRDHFKRQLETLATSNVDVYWLIGWYGQYGNRETNENPDMYWAEDLMINALQDRRTLSRDEICRCNYIEEQKLVEVRELAVTVGNFPAVLARMKSQKALPVLLSLIKENDPYVNDVVEVLGKFGDRTVEPLLMQILKKGDNRFGAAVQAAVDLRMKSIVPLLLQRLHRDDSVYYGLNELADASILPVLRRKLPALKSYERASARLLILKLQREDAVPELLRLLRDPKFLGRSDVIFRLEELKDNRATKDLTEVLCHDVDAPLRTFALLALAAIRTPDSMEGLIQGLDADYSNVQRMKLGPDYDYKKEFQKRIAEALKEITGKDFGADSNEWRKWLAANKDAI
jgi:HEAT repeat protein